ncbi:MAG: response regulator [Bacteriovoracaceae bacterium]|nr:response regulator [Bacteriovoracaceae bacterium]
MNHEMIDEFKKEAVKKLENIKNCFLNLNKGEDFLTQFNLILKSFHSLKGSTGMFGFMDLHLHIQKLESLFESQKNKGVITKAQIDYFLKGVEIALKKLNGESVDFNHASLTDFDFINSTAQTSNNKLSKPNNRGLIFIIDNDKNISETLIKLINEEGFNAKTFLSLSELLIALKIENPDLIIAEMKDNEILKKVRELNSNIPFIAISEKLTTEKIFDLLSQDVRGFIEKPIKEELIKPEVERVFAQSQVNALLQKSINYILYQYNELDIYLKDTSKENIRLSLKDELKNILHLQKKLIHKS